MQHETQTPNDGIVSERLTLYSSRWCGYCARVRYAADDMGIDLPMRDVGSDAGARDELIAGGGRGQVPCLRIRRDDGGVEWLYESLDIVEYLRRNFTTA